MVTERKKSRRKSPLRRELGEPEQVVAGRDRHERGEQQDEASLRRSSRRSAPRAASRTTAPSTSRTKRIPTSQVGTWTRELLPSSCELDALAQEVPPDRGREAEELAGELRRRLVCGEALEPEAEANDEVDGEEEEDEDDADRRRRQRVGRQPFLNASASDALRCSSGIGRCLDASMPFPRLPEIAVPGPRAAAGHAARNST